MNDLNIDKLHILFSKIPDFFFRIEEGCNTEKRGGVFGCLENDIEIKADRDLATFIHKFWSENLRDFCSIQIEGLGVDGDISKDYRLAVDPLDGSLNYKLRGRSFGLPMTTCMTLLKRQEKLTRFSDIVFAGVMDLRHPTDFWRVKMTETGKYKTYFRGIPAKTMQVDNLDIRSQILIAEMYYPSNREKICQAFANEKGWLRNPGSAAYEMALVASGQAVAFICDQQKQHELGAAYALVKGAGGVVVDWEGKDLGDQEYLFNAQTSVVVAANQTIAYQILKRLNL